MTSQMLPSHLDDEAQLDALLSRPWPELVDAMRTLDGDLLLVGAGGKIGPTLARLAKHAVDASGIPRRVAAVDVTDLSGLAAEGIETHRCDLMEPRALEAMPKCRNVVYLVGRKFGSTGAESLTWAVNCVAAYQAARALQGCRVAAFSTGCVYPLMHIRSAGALESTPPAPVGEYAQSCLGRERMWDIFADAGLIDVVHIRLNYAVECRYGVLHDIGLKVLRGEPVDVTTGYANVIWQGDACNQILLALSLASHPAAILNVTGPETLSVRQVAMEFARLLGHKAVIVGEENGMGYLSNASRANGLFGNPRVPLQKAIEYTAHWLARGGASLGKPTHFETQDGKY
ncbi:MAG: NAD(P)-dependent oxidoreductase [Lentisphaeria bacterium]|nr:NAD(P)-dependent oxidoreductase [Lentisphaeria bacterium]